MSLAALRSKGTVSQGTGARTPGAPPTVVVGDWLILYAGGFAGSLNPPTLSGWTLLTGVANSKQGAIYAQIAASTTPTMPAVDMGSATDQFAYCESWSGLPSTISGNTLSSERGANVLTGWANASLTPPVNGCLIIGLFVANKTSTTNGATIGNWTAGGGTFTQNASAMPAGAKARWVAESLLQTTATGISLGLANTTSINESTAQTQGGFLLAIKPSVAAPTFTGNPAKTSQTTNSVTFSATVDSAATLYGVAVTAGDTAPSAPQIIAGQNHAGTAAAGAANVSVSAAVAAALTVGSLSAGTYDFYFGASNTNGNSSIQSVTGVALSTSLTLAASIASADTGGYTINCTSTATGTLYAVSVVRGSAAPTAAQIRTATAPGQLTHNSKSCTASVATTISLTGQTLPVADVYALVNNGTTDSSVSVFASQLKAPTTGRQYVQLASSPSITSPLTTAGVAAAVNDIIDTIATTSVGYTVQVSAAGDFKILAKGDVSREIVPFNLYDDSAGAYYFTGDSQVVVNDKPPIFTTSPKDAFNFRLPSGTAIAPLDLNFLLTDSDGDNLGITDVNGVLAQFGLLINGSGQLTGSTPVFSGDQTVQLTLQGTDPFGASVQITGTLTVGQVQVPNVTGLVSEAVAAALLTAAFLREHGTAVNSAAPAGTVLSQSVLADAFADPQTVIELQISNGSLIGTTPPPSSGGQTTTVENPGALVARLTGVSFSLTDLSHFWGQDLSLSNTQDLMLASDTVHGQQKVLRRLLTNPGDVVFHPDYGAGLLKFVGSTSDVASITSVIRSQILLEDCVAKTPAPQITVTNLPNSSDGSALLITIVYTDSNTGASEPLSFSLAK